MIIFYIIGLIVSSLIGYVAVQYGFKKMFIFYYILDFLLIIISNGLGILSHIFAVLLIPAISSLIMSGYILLMYNISKKTFGSFLSRIFISIIVLFVILYFISLAIA